MLALQKYTQLLTTYLRKEPRCGHRQLGVIESGEAKHQSLARSERLETPVTCRDRERQDTSHSPGRGRGQTPVTYRVEERQDTSHLPGQKEVRHQ